MFTLSKNGRIGCEAIFSSDITALTNDYLSGNEATFVMAVTDMEGLFCGETHFNIDLNL